MSSLPIRVEGFAEVAAKLGAAPSKVQAAVRRAIEQSAASVAAGAKAKLSDEVLHVRTGRLRRSVHYAMGGSSEVPSAAIGTNVEYAGIHEFGGQTRAHIIEAINAKVLAFRLPSGEMAFAKRVQHPGSRMPERSFLRSTVGEQTTSIRERIKAAVRDSIPGA